MNPTKAAAILALIVTIGAAGYLVYQATLVRDAYRASVFACMSCTTAKEAAVAKWDYVQSQIELLKAQGKYKDAIKFQEQHEGDRPVNTDVPCSECYTPAPDFIMSGAVALVGLIVSLGLFGAAKSKT